MAREAALTASRSAGSEGSPAREAAPPLVRWRPTLPHVGSHRSTMGKGSDRSSTSVASPFGARQRAPIPALARAEERIGECYRCAGCARRCLDERSQHWGALRPRMRHLARLHAHTRHVRHQTRSDAHVHVACERAETKTLVARGRREAKSPADGPARWIVALEASRCDAAAARAWSLGRLAAREAR